MGTLDVLQQGNAGLQGALSEGMQRGLQVVQLGEQIQRNQFTMQMEQQKLDDAKQEKAMEMLGKFTDRKHPPKVRKIIADVYQKFVGSDPKLSHMLLSDENMQMILGDDVTADKIKQSAVAHAQAMAEGDLAKAAAINAELTSALQGDPDQLATWKGIIHPAEQSAIMSGRASTMQIGKTIADARQKGVYNSLSPEAKKWLDNPSALINTLNTPGSPLLGQAKSAFAEIEAQVGAVAQTQTESKVEKDKALAQGAQAKVPLIQAQTEEAKAKTADIQNKPQAAFKQALNKQIQDKSGAFSQLPLEQQQLLTEMSSPEGKFDIDNPKHLEALRALQNANADINLDFRERSAQVAEEKNALSKQRVAIALKSLNIREANQYGAITTKATVGNPIVKQIDQNLSYIERFNEIFNDPSQKLYKNDLNIAVEELNRIASGSSQMPISRENRQMIQSLRMDMKKSFGYLFKPGGNNIEVPRGFFAYYSTRLNQAKAILTDARDAAVQRQLNAYASTGKYDTKALQAVMDGSKRGDKEYPITPGQKPMSSKSAPKVDLALPESMADQTVPLTLDSPFAGMTLRQVKSMAEAAIAKGTDKDRVMKQYKELLKSLGE